MQIQRDLMLIQALISGHELILTNVYYLFLFIYFLIRRKPQVLVFVPVSLMYIFQDPELK